MSTAIQAISQTLDSEAYTGKIAASLDGTGISPERFKRSALAFLARPESSYLVEKCSKGSIYGALMNAAAAGLELHPALGQAYLVPRGGEAQLQVGYKGLIALAARHPKIAGVDAGVIREGDTYELVEGTQPRLEIRRTLTPGDWIAAYAVTHYADGVSVPTVMGRAEIESHRDRFSDAWKRGGKGAEVWKQNPEEMAKKTVLRRAAKLWPVAIPGGEDAGEVIEHRADVPPPMRTVSDPLDSIEQAMGESE